MADFTQRLSDEERSKIRRTAVMWARENRDESKRWTRAYQLKQKFTRKHSYCFQTDFYEFCKEAGLEVKITKDGDHWVKSLS